MEKYYVAGYKLAAHKLVSYPIDVNQRPRTAAQEENNKNLTRGDYNGYMSPKTKAKVSEMLNNWYASIYIARKRAKKSKQVVKPYLTFATLTLPVTQFHSDNEIKRKCLNLFLIKLKEYKGIEHYFWRAEAQGNGNIHFHIICDRYIDMLWLQRHWNLALNALGYIDKFELKWGHRQPPTTHIEKVTSLKDASKYVVNYMKKHEGRRIIEGRIWGCSAELRKIKSLCAIHSEDFAKFEAYLQSNKYVYQKQDSAYSVYCGDMFLLLSKNFKSLYKELELHYMLQYKQLYETIPILKVKPEFDVSFVPF